MRICATRPIIAAYPHSWRIDNGQQQPLTFILFRVLLTIRISITPGPTKYESSWCITHAAFELRSKVASKQLYRIFRIHQPLSFRNNPQVQISGGTEVIGVEELLPNTEHFPQFRIQAMILDHLNKQFYCPLPITTLKVLHYRLAISIIWRRYLHFQFLSQILRGIISRVDCLQLCHYIGGNCFEQNRIKFLFQVELVIVLIILSVFQVFRIILRVFACCAFHLHTFRFIPIEDFYTGEVESWRLCLIVELPNLESAQVVAAFYPGGPDKVIQEHKLRFGRHLNMHPVLWIIFPF